jgi:hypothetical protein
MEKKAVIDEAPKRDRRLGAHKKIGRAYRENRGVWLTPEDVDELWDDDAIQAAITQEWAD